ncbi:MAG: Holliday junction resolvase RuvX [Nisaea sp.]|nr:Holliday junction resolvase RuvX [Nisaea sp.]MEC7973423.1 Holliday junction resolvase RuvX [Pseudomonadota bacterium]
MQVPDLINNNVRSLVNVLPEGKKLLGIDLGTKTIGLAVSDPSLKIASPIKTLNRSKLKKNSPEIAFIASEHGIGGIIVGMPINMDGTVSARAQATKDWAFSLVELLFVPIAFWDERLSTAAVEKAMIKADLSRKRRAKRIDSAAATYILQGALDFIQMDTTKKSLDEK